MKAVLAGIVVCVIGAVVAVSAFAFLDAPKQRQRLAVMREENREINLTESFACGYRFGQMSIMNGMPSLFPRKEELGETIRESCERLKHLAARNGFNQ